jgi:hypothetical protein
MQARRCAALEAELVFIEDRIAKVRAEGGEPGPADLQLYVTLSNAQRRHAEALGWTRSARDITPSLSEYFERKQREAEAKARGSVVDAEIVVESDQQHKHRSLDQVPLLSVPGRSLPI